MADGCVSALVRMNATHLFVPDRAQGFSRGKLLTTKGDDRFHECAAAEQFAVEETAAGLRRSAAAVL